MGGTCASGIPTDYPVFLVEHVRAVCRMTRPVQSIFDPEKNSTFDRKNAKHDCSIPKSVKQRVGL